MTKQTGRKTLLIAFYAVALSLLLLTLISCYVPADDQYWEEETQEALSTVRIATYAAATQEAATAIVEVETYEAEATRTSEEGASTEPALTLEDVGVFVLSCSPYEFFGTPRPNEFVCSYDVTFSLEYVTAGHSAVLICFVGDGGESDRKPVSEGSGTSEVILAIEDMIVRGGGETKHSAFCQLRDASSDEWLAEAYLGTHAYDAALTMPVR
jgi:hypothetical protein